MKTSLLSNKTYGERGRLLFVMGSGLFRLHSISMVLVSEKTKPHLFQKNGVPSVHSI